MKYISTYPDQYQLFQKYHQKIVITAATVYNLQTRTQDFSEGAPTRKRGANLLFGQNLSKIA